MKVLVVSQRKLLPMTDGALIGSMGLLNYLHDLGLMIEVVTFIEDQGYTQDELDELKQIVNNVHYVKLHWRSTAFNLSLRYPNNIRKYKRKSMEKKIKEIKKNFHPDFVVIDHLQMYEYAKLFKDVRLVLHTHNVESNIWIDYAKDKKGIIKYLVNRSARLLRAYEINALKESSGVTACSDTDLFIFKKLVPEVNAAVFHSYLKFARIKTYADLKNVTKSIVYIGSYSWFPNQIAARYLVKNIMPILRQKLPGVKLYLVGKSPTEEIKAYSHNNEDIIVTGTVDSVDPYVKQSDVFVNAVEDGSGINIKMVEAMGKGIPIVTSIVGARGLDIEDGKNVLTYRTEYECVEQICRLINDREFAFELANNARKYYEHFIMPSDEVKNIFISQ